MQRLKLGQGKILNVYQRPTTIDYNAGWSSFNNQTIGSSVFSVDVDNCNNNVYIGGSFLDISGITSFQNAAAWTGTSWNDLNGGLIGGVGGVNVVKFDNLRRRVYYGGQFLKTNDFIALNNIGYWDISSSTWKQMGVGVSSAGLGIGVNAIEISGSRVFVGGNFNTMGGKNFTKFLAIWNDLSSNWFSIGNNLNANNSEPVNSIVVSGPNIYIANRFIRMWTGSVWSTFGTATGTGGGLVKSMVVGFNNNIYVGGQFTSITDASGLNIPANNIAVWNQTTSTWSPVIVNGINGLDNLVVSLAFKNNLLYAGGAFTQAGGLDVSNFAIYNGSSWSTLPGSTFNFEIKSVAVGNNSSVYVGGDFNPDPQPYFATNIATTTPAGGSSSAIDLITASKRIGISRQ